MLVLALPPPSRRHSHNEAYKRQGLMEDTPISKMVRKQLRVKHILFH